MHDADTQRSQKPPERAHILVVAESRHICSIVAVLLQPLGYRLSFVQRLSEAREVIREDRPTLVILDVWLPHDSEACPPGGYRGFEFSRELREDPSTAALPVILLPLRAGDDAVFGPKMRHFLAREERPHLYQPFSPLALWALVREILEPPDPPTEPHHLLVVDDDPSAVGSGLERAGFRVTGASSLASAREVIRADPPALVVLYFFLGLGVPERIPLLSPPSPDASPTLLELSEASLKFCQELRSGEATAHLPVILLGIQWTDSRSWGTAIPPLMAPARLPVIYKPCRSEEVAALAKFLLVEGEDATPPWYRIRST